MQTDTHHRTPEQRPNAEAAHHERDGERGDDLADVELGLDVLEVARDERARKRDLDDRERRDRRDVCKNPISMRKARCGV